MDGMFKILSKEKVHTGKRIHLYDVTLEAPDKKNVVWENIEHRGASAIVAVDEDDKIILVRQYRLAANDLVLEVPAGVFDADNEDPMECAKRELEEETGNVGEHFEFLLKFYPAIGYASEVIHVFLAKGLTETAQNLDDDEYCTIERYSLDELLEMIKNGEIVDSKTVTALLYYYQYKVMNNL